MIPQKPEILKAPLVADGEKNILPETTPQGSNQFSLLGGFPTLTSLPVNAGGLPPKRLDFNAVFNLLSIHTFFLQSGNKYSWSSELDYSIGGVVLASNNSIYLCIKANGATPPNTVQNPVSSSGYWVELVNSKGTINIDLIADGAITSAKIQDGTIVNADIANTTITGSKLANSTVTATQLANNAVTNAKIANGAITSDKLANNAVTNAKIANGAVTNAKIANGAVDNNKISGVAASKVSGLATVAKTGSYNDLTNKPNIPTNIPPMPTNNNWLSIAGQDVKPMTYVLPVGGTYAYFITMTNFTNYNAVDNKVGVQPGGTQIIFVSNSAKTFGGLIWRVQ